MKKNYQKPQTNLLRVESSILCASGGLNSGGGTISYINQTEGSW